MTLSPIPNRRHGALFATALFVSLLFRPTGPFGAEEPFRVGFPALCSPGVDCWLVNNVDIDPASERSLDHACGTATYDGHDGTDVALADFPAMRAGVPVLAAAAGTVVGVRDGMPDVTVSSDESRAAVRNRECGNGVRIDHGENWVTQYCHMRKGSLTVRKGDSVDRGQSIGLIGNSGLAEFPHLHFQVEFNGRVVDPFLGPSDAAKCSQGHPIWRTDIDADLSYKPTVIFNAGFASSLPDAPGVREGRYADIELPARSSALIFWAELYWVRKGDRVTITVKGPDGRIVHNRTIIIDRSQAWRFLYSGLRLKSDAWPGGTYAGLVVLERDGPPVSERYAAERSVVVR